MIPLIDPDLHEHVWTPTSRLYNRADEGHPERRVLDCSIGWQNYQGADRLWRPADPDYMEPDGDGFSAKFSHVPKLLRGGDDGSKRAYLVPGDDSVWVQLYKPTELPNLGAPVKQGGLWTWDRDAFTFKVRFGASRVKFDLVLKRNVGINTLHIPFAVSGITRQGRYLMHDGVAVAEIRVPTVTDARIRAQIAAGDLSVEPIPMNWEIRDGEIILSIDSTWLAQAQYPVEIDPPLDLQVGADADDVSRRITPGAWGFSSYLAAGGQSATEWQRGSGMRFQVVLVSQGATIDNAYLTVRCIYARSGTVVRTRISAEDIDDAPTFIDSAIAFDARWANRTTARVDWDGIPAWTENTDYNSPSFVSVIKEIVDRPSWASGNDIVIFWDDFEDRSDHNNNTGRFVYSYTDSATYAAKLHIEFTPGGVGGIGAFYMQHNPLGVNILSAGIG